MLYELFQVVGTPAHNIFEYLNGVRLLRRLKFVCVYVCMYVCEVELIFSYSNVETIE